MSTNSPHLLRESDAEAARTVFKPGPTPGLGSPMGVIVKLSRLRAERILEGKQLNILWITTHGDGDLLPKHQIIRGTRHIAGIHQAGAKNQQG